MIHAETSVSIQYQVYGHKAVLLSANHKYRTREITRVRRAIRNQPAFTYSYRKVSTRPHILCIVYDVIMWAGIACILGTSLPVPVSSQLVLFCVGICTILTAYICSPYCYAYWGSNGLSREGWVNGWVSECAVFEYTSFCCSNGHIDRTTNAISQYSQWFGGAERILHSYMASNDDTDDDDDNQELLPVGMCVASAQRDSTGKQRE